MLLFLFLALSLASCGGNGGTGASATPTSTPGTLTDQPGTGPKGLPLYCPLAVTVDHQDTIYVSDNDNSTVHERIIKLSTTGQALGEWHLFPPGNIGKAQGPGSSAFDAQGNMYVVDMGRYKVLKVSPSGKILTSWGSYGSGQGQFEQPLAMAVDSHDNVYVGDNERDSARVEKFSGTGTFLGIVLTQVRPQRLSRFTDFNPIGLAIDSSDNLYVANGVYVTKLSPTGQVLGKLQITDYTSHVVRIWAGLSINARGDLYATHLTFDSDNFYPRIMKIDVVTGKVLTVWNIWKSGANLVESIAFDSPGNLYATEMTRTGAMLLQKFSSTGESLATWQGACS
ncbi:MAG: NHL repeat-containing protein [Ktedonobacteraceae bacterium]